MKSKEEYLYMMALRHGYEYKLEYCSDIWSDVRFYTVIGMPNCLVYCENGKFKLAIGNVLTTADHIKLYRWAGSDTEWLPIGDRLQTFIDSEEALHGRE